MEDVKTMSTAGGMAAGKEMTFKDVIGKLKEDLCDEIKDTKKYLEMSKVAEHAGHGKAARYLHEIAKDEYSHATFIYEYLIEEGIEIPEKDSLKYQELKTMASRAFHN